MISKGAEREGGLGSGGLAAMQSLLGPDPMENFGARMALFIPGENKTFVHLN